MRYVLTVLEVRIVLPVEEAGEVNNAGTLHLTTNEVREKEPAETGERCRRVRACERAYVLSAHENCSDLASV